MDKEFLMEYCGPYSIQTSSAVISEQIIDSETLIVEREQLRDMEQPVVQDYTQMGR